jgi:hypothetical protein
MKTRNLTIFYIETLFRISFDKKGDRMALLLKRAAHKNKF